MGVKADEYRSLLEQGPPTADPQTPEEQDALFKYYDTLSTAKLDMEAEEKELMKPHPLEPDDLSNDPAVNAFYADALANGMTQQRDIAKMPKPLPLDVSRERSSLSDANEIEDVPEKAALLNANVEGFDPLIKGRLLQVYKDTLDEGGSKQDAFRRFLLYRRDTLSGPSQTGWPEFPGGAPNEDFWKRFEQTEPGAYSQDNPQSQQVNYLRNLYNFYRQEGIPKYTDAELAGSDLSDGTLVEVKNQLHKLGLDGRGPLDPFDAWTAVSAYARAHPQKFEVMKQRRSLDFDLMTAAAGGPLAPIARGALGGVAGVATVVGANAIQSKLPEGTPPAVRTAIDFGLYSIGNRGGIKTRLLQGLSTGLAAGAGEFAAEKAGVPGIVGAFGGPVLSPMTAGVVKRQFQWMAEQGAKGAVDNPELLQKELQKLAIDMGDDAVGTTIAVGDNLGVVDGLVGKDHIQVTLDNGMSLTLRKDDVIRMPGMGKSGTIAQEAERTRAGGLAEDAEPDFPLQITAEGLDAMPVGEMAVHYTAPENAQSIMKDGFKPSQPSRESYPGVYVAPPSSSGRIAEGSLDATAIYVQVPGGAIADAATAERVRARLGVGKDAEGNIAVARELQDQGYVGLDQRPGSRVYFDPQALKPSIAAKGATSWGDLVDFTRGVVTGKARVQLLQSSGGAVIQGLSKETNMLVSQVTTNGYDFRMLASALRQGQKPLNSLPGSVFGSVYLTAKAIAGLNPGIMKQLQPIAFATTNYMEAQQARIASSMFVMQKVVKEAFGRNFLENPEGRHLLDAYIGPAMKGTAGDYVIGTLSHAIDQPKLYKLTPTQTQVIDLWQDMLKHDANVTEKAGVTFDLIQENYVPYRSKDADPTFAQRLLSPKTKSHGTGMGGTGFTKERTSRSLDEWAELLASKGERAELDPFKLYMGRLQGAAKLRADQVFLRSVIAQAGRRIDSPAQIKALQVTRDKMAAQLSGRLKTATGQMARLSGLETGSNRIESLLQATEKELGKVDEKLFETTGIDSPVWNNLEGQLQALDKEADLIAGSALRQDKSIDDVMDKHARTKKEIAILRGQLKGIRHQLQSVKTARAPSGWTEVGVGKPLGGRYAVPDDIAQEMKLMLNPKETGNITAMGEEVVDWMRSMLLSVDASFMTNQGMATFAVDPVKYLGKMGSFAQAVSTNEGFMTYMTLNIDAFTKFAQAGGVLYTNANDVIRRGGSEIVGSKGKIFGRPLSEMTPGVSQINDFGYERFLPVMKMMGWQTMTQMLDNLSSNKSGMQWFLEQLPFDTTGAQKIFNKLAGVEGMSPQQIQEAAADVINNVSGGINYGKIGHNPGLAGKLIFLTEGWMRANVGRIVNATKVGDPRGVLARRWMFQNIAMASVMSTMASLQFSGRLPNYDPTATDFLDIQVGDPSDLNGATIPILPGKTYIRAVFQGIAGVPWDTEDSELEQRVGALNNFAQGRTGQLLRLGMDLNSGTDYLGRPIDDKLLYVARNAAPVAIQNLVDNMEGKNPNASWSTGLGFLGWNWIPRNPYDARDAKVMAEGISDPVTGERLLEYGGLTDSMRAEFDAKFPEYTEGVVKWQEERDSPYAALRDVRNAHRGAVEALGKAFRGEPLSDNERALLGSDGANIEQIRRNTVLYRQMLGNLSDFYRQEAARKGQGEESFAPKSTAQKIVTEYYTEVIDKARFGGGLDYTLLDANERAYRRKVEEEYGQAGLDVLDQELLYRTTDDPVAQAYHKDQTTWNPYFDYLDGFWKPDNIEYAGFSPEAAAEAAKFPNKEQYQVWLTQAYVDQLVGQPLPDNIYKLKSSQNADTIGQKWGIQPGKRLTEQQAQDIGEELVRIRMKKYNDLIGKASDAYLKQNNEALCAMSYWGIKEPTEATRPYLALCPVR